MIRMRVENALMITSFFVQKTIITVPSSGPFQFVYFFLPIPNQFQGLSPGSVRASCNIGMISWESVSCLPTCLFFSFFTVVNDVDLMDEAQCIFMACLWIVVHLEDNAHRFVLWVSLCGYYIIPTEIPDPLSPSLRIYKLHLHSLYNYHTNRSPGSGKEIYFTVPITIRLIYQLYTSVYNPYNLSLSHLTWKQSDQRRITKQYHNQSK